MDERLSLITLGVCDVSRARAFYRGARLAPGWGRGRRERPRRLLPDTGAHRGAWDRGKLAADSGVEEGGGWGGVTLAYNVRSPDEVDGSSSGLRMRRSRSTIWNNSYKRTSSPTWMRSQ